MTVNSASQWQLLARQLRVDSIRATTAAGSGHPTSSMSAADLMAVLMTKYLRYDFGEPRAPGNDRFILSKGHAAPLLYAMFKAAGAISDDELLSLRKFGSRLEGHPTPVAPWVDVATGSLGQGLPIGVGVALAGKYLDKLPYRVWVLLGDSETAEGSVWEALDHASFYRLANLVAIIDVNRLGQRGQTMLGWDLRAYAQRVRAFGWHAVQIDGHDFTQIDNAYAEAVTNRDRPTAIIAHTLKGKGVSFLENAEGWHGKALKPDEAAKALAELGGETSLIVAVPKPAPAQPLHVAGDAKLPALPAYDKGASIPTRRAYGDALKSLGAVRRDIVVLDGEVSNSTFAEEFAKAYPERYFEMYISEQQMMAAAVGLQVRGYRPFASTFAAFVSRAVDFIRMGSISRANIKLSGSHAGVSIGQDGPSQMGLEDIACMRAMWSSTVLYPCDANQTVKLVAQMVDRDGIAYLRTTREGTPVLYDRADEFPIGGSKVLRSSDRDQAAVIAAGITVHEALKACDALRSEGIAARIIDAYCVRPIDVETLKRAACECDGNVVVVEDHRPEGGLGSAVLDAFAADSSARPYDGPPLRVIKLAVSNMPGSGTPAELLHEAGIDAATIVAAVKSLVQQPVPAK